MSMKRDTVWTGLDTLISQGLAFAFRLLLAKILAPEAFGLIAMALATVSILEVLNDFGFTAGIIQKDKAGLTPALVNSTFTLSLAISSALFVLNWIAFAPLASHFYVQPELSTLIGVVGSGLLLAPIASIGRALMLRDRRFKEITMLRVSSQAAGLLVGLVILLMYRTVWAFAAQVVVSQVCLAIGIFLRSGWRPRLGFDAAGLRDLIQYSGLVFVNDLVTTLSTNVQIIILGFMLDARSVGTFALAVYFTNIVRQQLMSILNRVAFVHISQDRTNLAAVRRTYLTIVEWNCQVILPLMSAIIMFGPSLAIHFMGPEWADLDPALRILAASVMVQTIGGASSTVFKAIGRPGLDMNLFVIANVITLIPLMVLGIWWGGLTGATIAILATKIFSVLLRRVYLDRLIGSTAWETVTLVARILLAQVPIFALGLAGHALFPTGGWMLDLVLLVVSLAVYGAIVGTLFMRRRAAAKAAAKKPVAAPSTSSATVDETIE